MSFTRTLTIPNTANENANIDLGGKIGFILAAGLQQVDVVGWGQYVDDVVLKCVGTRLSFLAAVCITNVYYFCWERQPITPR